jgi:hypothetical protein
MRDVSKAEREAIACFKDWQLAENKLHIAKGVAKHKEAAFQSACKTMAEGGRIEVSTASCSHPDIAYHVYRHRDGRAMMRDCGNYVCIFCGADDFDL